MQDGGKRPAFIVASIAAIAVLTGPATAGAQGQFVAARYVSGDPPVIPAAAVSGGEVFVELTVTNAGYVDRVTASRVTPPFTQYVLDTVRHWRFQPALQVGSAVSGAGVAIAPGPVRSRVLVACVFRPPVLTGPTLGEAPKDVASAADDVAFPLSTVPPPYPPLAVADATVVVQVTVGVTGNVLNAITVQSVPGFDEAALGAARQWTFRPARIHGLLEETQAYLVFGFRRPVTFMP